MKQNICKWNGEGQGGELDRFVGWIEGIPGSEEEPIILHVALHATFAGNDHKRHYRENRAGDCNANEEVLPPDFETMWRMGKKIQDAPENCHLVGHYRKFGM